MVSFRPLRDTISIVRLFNIEIKIPLQILKTVSNSNYIKKIPLDSHNHKDSHNRRNSAFHSKTRSTGSKSLCRGGCPVAGMRKSRRRAPFLTFSMIGREKEDRLTLTPTSRHLAFVSRPRFFQPWHGTSSFVRLPAIFPFSGNRLRPVRGIENGSPLSCIPPFFSPLLLQYSENIGETCVWYSVWDRCRLVGKDRGER